MAVSAEDVQTLAQALLGRDVAPEFLEQFTEFENPAAFMTQCTTLQRRLTIVKQVLPPV